MADIKLINSRGEAIFSDRSMLTAVDGNGNRLAFCGASNSFSPGFFKEKQIKEGKDTFAFVVEINGEDVYRRSFIIDYSE